MSVSDRNNRRDGLTGALAVSRGRFFQVLEGESPAVDDVMRRIRADPRHSDLKDVMRCEVEGRLFGAWSLVAALVSPTLQPELDRAIELCESQPEAAVQALLALVERQQRG